MDYFEVVRKRQSIRAFQQKPVEEEKLLKILETANAAPSAGNLQAYDIFVVRKADQKKALVRAALGQEFILAAGVVLVFCANSTHNARRYGERGRRLYAVQDAAVACTYAMLAAAALELGTVWVGAFNDDAVRQVIDAPENVTPVAILPIGYPAETPDRTPRRPLSKLVHEL
jgi:nitroreductase